MCTYGNGATCTCTGIASSSITCGANGTCVCSSGTSCTVDGAGAVATCLAGSQCTVFQGNVTCKTGSSCWCGINSFCRCESGALCTATGADPNGGPTYKLPNCGACQVTGCPLNTSSTSVTSSGCSVQASPCLLRYVDGTILSCGLPGATCSTLGTVSCSGSMMKNCGRMGASPVLSCLVGSNCTCLWNSTCYLQPGSTASCSSGASCVQCPSGLCQQGQSQVQLRVVYGNGSTCVCQGSQIGSLAACSANNPCLCNSGSSCIVDVAGTVATCLAGSRGTVFRGNATCQAGSVCWCGINSFCTCAAGATCTATGAPLFVQQGQSQSSGTACAVNPNGGSTYSVTDCSSCSSTVLPSARHSARSR